jgi:tetratricopeptide (TPR) repeat protein
MTLVRKDLLRPDRAVFAGEDAFAFRHLLIRDAAYESLPKMERAELHASFAGWLVERGGDLEELDEIAGYHLEQAYRYRTELGPSDAGARALAAAAAGHLETAGRRALDRGDTAAAVNLLERADVLLPTQQVDPALEEALIQGLGMAGRLSDAVARSDRAAAGYSAAGNTLYELRLRLAGALWRTNLDPAAGEDQLRLTVERARPLIEASGDDRALASLEFASGYVEHYRCRFEAGFASLSRSIQHATRADDLWLARSIRNVAAAAVTLGPVPAEDAQRWLEREQVEVGGFMPMLDIFRASVLALRGRFDEARSAFRLTLEQITERGMRTAAAIAMQAGWEIETLAGDLESAERMARLGCEQLDQLGERAWLSTQECQLAEALYALGRYDESEERVLRGLEFGGSDDVVTQLLALQVRAKLSARGLDHFTAFSLAVQAVELAGATQAPLLKGDAALALAEVLHLAGEVSQAEAETERAIEHYAGKGAVACVANARRLAATWGTPRPAP